MKLSLITTFLLLIIKLTITVYAGAAAEMNAAKLNLPKTVGVWVRPDSPQVITSENIFKYMNGAGELYLGYRFRHLEVFDYTSANQDNILVELYFMETSDDAFGLLSLDWGGESVSFKDSPANMSSPSPTSAATALYGAGLLRVWSDNLYARVMAYRETSATKEAVLALGRAIAINRKSAPRPDMLNMISPQVGTDWKLRSDRLSFFRSYLVLNSIYYLSEKNILDLDLSTQAIIAPYESISNATDRKYSQFLLVQYANLERARNALNHFHGTYLPEYQKEIPADAAADSARLYKLEDGWLAYKLLGKYIVIVFACPDQESARAILQKNESRLKKGDKS